MCRNFFFNYQSCSFKGYEQYPGSLVWWEGEGINFFYILNKKRWLHSLFGNIDPFKRFLVFLGVNNAHYMAFPICTTFI